MSHDETTQKRTQNQQRQSPGQPRTQQQQQQASVPLVADEQVLIDARPAWSAYAIQFLLAGLILLSGLIAGDDATIGAVLIAAVLVGYVVYQRRRVRYVVTDRRMMKVTGISSKATSEAWMVDIRGLQTGASFMERLLGHGHITVSADILSTGFGRFRGMTFGGISNYEEIATIIRKRQNATKM